MLNRRLDLWLPTYAFTAPSRAYSRLRRHGQLTHIMFLVCDHFEPRHGIRSEDQPAERMRIWKQEYAAFQERCRTQFGAAPLHSFFYPPHHGTEHLPALADMVFDGLGEVELHYHHRDDTAESLRAKLRESLAEYHRWGLLLESGATPRPSFGFIHGDWALDNSRYGTLCGVNGELSLLRELGCWADFTMPSANMCQTRKINSIYYAVDDPCRSKSHNWGVDARVGRKDPPGLFLMQGPLGINWRAPGHPRVENASLTTDNWGRPDRIRKWIHCNVHVKGRPEWQFVKLHTHGAIERDFDALFGHKAFEMHKVLNERYNDGQRYRLHYVTARQAYNIAKAAEHGKTGSPDEWVDYLLPPQPNSFYVLDAQHDLVRCGADALELRNIAAGRTVRLRTRVGGIESVTGAFETIAIDARAGTLALTTTARTGIEVKAAPGLDFRQAGGLTRDSAGNVRFTVEGRCSIRYRG